MKKLLFLLLLCAGLQARGQQANPIYDKALADSLGADEYGMRSYIFVILKTGENTINDQAKVSELFKGHLANINQLVKEGRLIVAGPFGKNEQSYRGLFILTCNSVDEAKEILLTDPAIKEKLLKPEFYEWYGSAALPVYLETAKKISKVSY